MTDYIQSLYLILFSIIGIVILYFIFSKILKIGFDQKKEIQKIHTMLSIRTGGIFIILLTIIPLFFLEIFDGFPMFTIFLIPLVCIAIFEDLYQNISIKLRFLAMIFTAIMLVFHSNAFLVDIDIRYLNVILQNKVLSIFITSIGIIVTCNAWNFIDGLNGIASGLGSIVLFLFYLISGPDEIYINGFRDFLLILSCITFGFFIVNVFTGKVFLGDTGSYLLGILIGWSGVIIVSYNENISPWAIFIIIIYPASEITVSVFRRIINKKSPFHADKLHLHSLVHTMISEKFRVNNQVINSLCGVLILLFATIPGFYCIYINGLFPKTIYTVFIFFILYVSIYNILIFILKKQSISV